MQRIRVRLLQDYLRANLGLRRFLARRSFVIEAGAWALILLIGVLAARPLSRFLANTIGKDSFDGLQTLIVTIGGAMIGATAIVSSFVLFAMQVNVERLPHGLFRRFSLDFRLLGAFAASFAFAIAGTALSLIQDHRFAGLMILLGIGAAIVVLRLLFGAFRRSLVLVNPIEQLKLVQASAERQARILERRLNWVVPLLQQAQPSPADDEKENDGGSDGSQIDAARFAVLHANGSWNRALRETIGHAVAYARRAGEEGDKEVSAAALATVVALNRSYIRVKGRTFHANVPFFDNPLATDAFINNSLEELRRLRDVALARKDEQQSEQIFRTFLALVQVYSEIEYPGLKASKSHALLAAGYLERSVQAAIPLGLVDTAMAGLRTLGDAGRSFLKLGDAAEMTSMAKTIGMIGSAGTLREDFRPLTLTAMEQLSDLTIDLLRTKSSEVRFAAGEIRSSVQQITRLFLEIPDSPLTSTHSFYLGPYFSSTSLTSLRSKLTDLVNALLNSDADNEAAQVIANNIEEWAEELHQGLKELLLLAIEKRSHFAFDLIHWITGISELLVGAANAPATRDHTRNELKKHASWLFATLSWIPRDAETARWVEHLSFVKTVFEFALQSLGRGFEDGFDDAWKLLFNWGVEAGGNETGWGTLERCLTALVALALRPGHECPDLLKKQLKAALALSNAPSQTLRDRAARDLREKALAVRDRELEFNSVARVLAKNDRKSTQKLLREIANILSPGTAKEPVGTFF